MEGLPGTTRNTTPLEERPHVFRLGWCADYPDENNWVHEVFNTDEGANNFSWEADANAPLGPNGESFNELTKAAQLASDPAERAALYKEAEKIMSEVAAPYAPIYYYTTVQMSKPYLQRTFFNLGGNRFETFVIDAAAKKEATGM